METTIKIKKQAKGEPVTIQFNLTFNTIKNTLLVGASLALGFFLAKGNWGVASTLLFAIIVYAGALQAISKKGK